MNALLLTLVLASAQEPQPGGAAPQGVVQEPAQGIQEPAEEPAQPAGQGDTVSVETRLATLFEGALVDSQNGDPFAETPGYAKLITSLSAYSPEEVSARATRDLDYAAVMSDPDRFRGEFLRVRGLIIHLEAYRLERPIFGTVDVYRGAVAKADGSEGVWFDMLEPPPTVDLKDDVVDLEGIFYRTVRFENLKDQVQDAPWLIVRNFSRPDPDSLKRNFGPSQSVMIVLFGLALAYFAGRLIVFLRQQHKQRTRSEPRQKSIRQMMLEERRKTDRESPSPPRS